MEPGYKSCCTGACGNNCEIKSTSLKRTLSKSLEIKRQQTFKRQENEGIKMIWERLAADMGTKGPEFFETEAIRTFNELFDQSSNQLTSLTSLHLLSLNISTLPSKLGLLKNVKEVALNENHFLSIPDAIFELTHVKKLLLTDNRLLIVSHKISQLVNLEVFHLDCNNLDTLPDEMEHLSNLKNLNIRSNKFYELPTPIQKLTCLRILNISRNNLKYLPDGISNLKNLRQLSAAENQLEALPLGINSLTSLRHLDCTKNSLTRISSSFCALTNLRCLYLDHNLLTKLPKKFDQLTGLVELDLASNAITSTQAESLSEIFKYTEEFSIQDQTEKVDHLKKFPKEDNSLKSPIDCGLTDSRVSLITAGNNKEVFKDIEQVSIKGETEEGKQLKPLPKEFWLLRGLSGLELTNIQANNKESEHLAKRLTDWEASFTSNQKDTNQDQILHSAPADEKRYIRRKELQAIYTESDAKVGP